MQTVYPRDQAQFQSGEGFKHEYMDVTSGFYYLDIMLYEELMPPYFIITVRRSASILCAVFKWLINTDGGAKLIY